MLKFWFCRLLFIFTIKDQSIEDVLENCVKGGILTKIIEQQISYESKLEMFSLPIYPFVIRILPDGDRLKRPVPVGDRSSVHVKLLSQNKNLMGMLTSTVFTRKSNPELLLVFKSGAGTVCIHMRGVVIKNGQFGWWIKGGIWPLAVLPASVFKKQKCFFVLFFSIMVFFCCGKVFFSAFFFFKMCFFFLNHAGESQVLQIFIAISEFLGNSFINFPQNLVLLLRGQ